MSRTARTGDEHMSPLAGLGRLPGNGSLPPGETALMRAVLEDAIICYLGHAKRRRIDPQILAREAEYWLLSHDLESPFSFENVCGVLGLCPESTREEIVSWKEHGLPSTILSEDGETRESIH